MKRILVGLAFACACGPEYGECGYGNTMCELDRAQSMADRTNTDIFVDVDLNNSIDIDVNIEIAPPVCCNSCANDAGIADAGKPLFDSGIPDAGKPKVCKLVCTKYKVSCKKKKTCIKQAEKCS